LPESHAEGGKRYEVDTCGRFDKHFTRVNYGRSKNNPAHFENAAWGMNAMTGGMAYFAQGRNLRA
jgi:hypothetical protein